MSNTLNMSRARLGPRVDDASCLLPPPTQPMAVARKLAEALYSSPAGLLLRHHRGGWYEYTGTCWPQVAAQSVRVATYDYLEHALFEKYVKGRVTIEPWAPTRRKVDDVIDALRAVTHLDAGEPPVWSPARPTMPPAPELIAMTNGLLHVPSRTLYDHTPAFFSQHVLAFPFEPDAPSPRRWLAFLGEIWEEDETSIDLLQEIFGYVLAGDSRQHKIFLVVGPRRAGKGTIGRVLTGLLGSHNVAAPTLAGLCTNFGLQPLIDRPLALVSDARLSSRSDGQIVVERLLSISGEDSLTIDRKYRESWTGRLPTRFLVLTNELPRLIDSSGALASRFVVLVLKKSFFGREDPYLTDKLLAEAPGILNWALDGFNRLTQRGYFVSCESGSDAVQVLEDLSSPISAFVRERCRLGAQEQVPVDALWAAWREWCTGQNANPGSKSVFGRDLKARAPTVHKTRPRDDEAGRVHLYEGIGLKQIGVAGPTARSRCDHHDQSDRSQQRSPHGHGTWSRQASNDGAYGHGGHGNTRSDVSRRADGCSE